jgi:hypothetical protein
MPRAKSLLLLHGHWKSICEASTLTVDLLSAIFPPALSSALADFQRSFSQQHVDEDEVMIHIHTVFCELFLVEERSLASEKDLPLVQYLIFCMLDYEGTFKSLQEVRHLTAILTYWCRLVVYVEITKQDWDVQR